MVSCRSHLHSFFKSFDLFPTTQFIRYNGESEYTTVTGGIVSTVVLAIFVILFASMGIRTINRQIITSSVSTEYSIESPELKFNTSVSGEFMFSVLPLTFFFN